MKKSIFTLALAFIAMFGFNAAQAQSLIDYKTSYDEITGSLTISEAKVGGFGKKTPKLEMTVYLNYYSTIDCEKTLENSGKSDGNLLSHTAEENSRNHGVTWATSPSTGTGTQLIPLTVAVDPSVASCGAPKSGWKAVNDSGESMVTAWVIINGTDDKGNTKTSGIIPIELNR